MEKIAARRTPHIRTPHAAHRTPYIRTTARRIAARPPVRKAKIVVCCRSKPNLSDND